MGADDASRTKPAGRIGVDSTAVDSTRGRDGAMNDDVPDIGIETPEDMVKYTERWIRQNEAELERLAAETGKSQKRTIGIAVDPKQATLLQVEITCEPRRFAQRLATGAWAKLFVPPEQK